MCSWVQPAQREEDLRARWREHTREIERKTGAVIPYVFHRRGQPIRSFRTAWRNACRRAGLVGMLPHDFRRTAVRNLERAGVPRSVAMKLVGHKTEAIYRRYAIVCQRDLAEGVAKLAALRMATPAAARTTLPFGHNLGHNSAPVGMVAINGAEREAVVGG